VIIIIVRLKHLKTGEEAVISNANQVQGQVEIMGAEKFSSILHQHFNVFLQIGHREQVQHLRKILPQECIIKNPSGIYEVYKASDSYLNKYFIPKFCPLHGYEVVSIK